MQRISRLQFHRLRYNCVFFSPPPKSDYRHATRSFTILSEACGFSGCEIFCYAEASFLSFFPSSSQSIRLSARYQIFKVALRNQQHEFLPLPFHHQTQSHPVHKSHSPSIVLHLILTHRFYLSPSPPIPASIPLLPHPRLSQSTIPYSCPASPYFLTSNRRN